MTLQKSNAELEELLSGLQSIASETIMLPVDISYKIIKNRLAIEKSLLPYRIAKDEIINHYSNGKGKIEEKEDPVTFQKVFNEICDISKVVTNVDIDTVLLMEFGQKEVPYNIISAISFMLVE